ncbi:MAG: DUF692 domain-containing protein [Candidatus Binataceae bacterium]
MKRGDFPFIGYGVGLRRPHYAEILQRRPAMDWFELVTENFMGAGGRPLQVLDEVRANYPTVMHGVSLSVGSADPQNRGYLRDLAALARRIEPSWISDHLCWTGVGGRNLHDLLPLPYTEEAVLHTARRIREVQEILGRRIMIENVSTYLEYRSSRLTEWEFVAAVAEEADCGILLDINNVFVNAFNHRFNSLTYLGALPMERVAQFHLAGHRDCGSYLLDTHDHPVCEQVWSLYEYAVRRFGALSTLIEWDDQIPPFDVLAAIADEARKRAANAVADQPLARDGTVSERPVA